jgi:diguanylate cyclase (GGDEF)-like protein
MGDQDDVMTAEGASRRMYWVFVIGYLVIGMAHPITLLSTSGLTTWVASDFIVGVAQWTTLAALAWRFRRSNFPNTFRWGVAIAGLAFVNLANDNDLAMHYSGGSSPVPGASIFCDAIYVALVLLSFSTTFRGRTMRATNLIDGSLVVTLTGFFFVRTFSLVSLFGTDNTEHIRFIILMFDVIGIFITLCASVRLLGTDEAPSRHFFFVLASYLLTSTAVAAVRNRLILASQSSFLEFLLLPQFVVLGLLCLRPLPRWLENYRPRLTLVHVTESLSPLFLGLGLLGVSISVFKGYPILGSIGASIAVVGYGVRNVVTQSEQMATEHSLKLLQKELENQVVTDPLTGIANRRGFDAVLARMWNRVETPDMYLSVLMIDIDHFKRFNDEYGHALGDICLSAVAACLDQTLTPLGCFIARNGGEEFAVLLPATTLQQALELGKALRRSVAEITLPCGDELLSVRVSIGLANSEKSSASSPKALMVLADKALYDAESRGRNQVAWRESIDNN